jgi:HD-GYP domain-containing protein (c-di-GMP phosphodiesterase class II)
VPAPAAVTEPTVGRPADANGGIGAPSRAMAEPGRVAASPSEPERGASETGEPRAGLEADVPPPTRRAALVTDPELEARRDYELLEQWLAGIFIEARSGELRCADVFDDVGAILERPRLTEALFAETFRIHPLAHFLARKSLNVAIYALRLARTLHYEGEALVDVGTAAMLHKIGLARVPEEQIVRPGKLTGKELAALRSHPRVGAEMLRSLGGRFTTIADIVMDAHERLDGSGYPRGLRGDGIRPESLVIGLVDVFEALIQPRPYRERMLPFAAVKELLEREKTRFPRAFLREFIASFSVFPPFTYVRLNSKAIARVVDTEPGYPLRPQVSIVLDANGRKTKSPVTMRLVDAPLLYITGPVAEEEVPL